MNKLRELISDLLSFEKCYNLESVCDKYKLSESDEALEPCSNKKKYVLSRIKLKDEQYLLNLAHQLIEYSGPHFAKSIEIYFPEGLFKLSEATRKSLIEIFLSIDKTCDVRSVIKNSWDIDLENSQYFFDPVEINDIPLEEIFINLIDFMYVSDKSIINFLELLTHPRCCDENIQNKLIDKINNIISSDGFKLKEEGHNSGRLFYKIYSLKNGQTGKVKNLIFSAVGLKPELVLSDSLNNDIKIVKNEENCLIYDKPIPKNGLTWKNLITWWETSKYCNDASNSERELYLRLVKSLDSPPEKIFFNTYFKHFRGKYKYLPALIPQVYLHYDPYTLKQLKGKKRLARQRMDFLLLLPLGNRLVIEIDGKHHYSVGDKSSPKLYSEMVSEDRELKLRGYDVFRFGGYELSNNSSEVLIKQFIYKLFKKHAITETNT